MEEMGAMTATRGRVVEGGRIIVPAAFRKALGLEKGDTVLMEMRGDTLVVRPAKMALRRIQERLRPYRGEGYVVDELIVERRAEAAHDD
jgi:AbrB family looped-hinge helix DNA binding protein